MIAHCAVIMLDRDILHAIRDWLRLMWLGMELGKVNLYHRPNKILPELVFSVIPANVFSAQINALALWLEWHPSCVICIYSKEDVNWAYPGDVCMVFNTFLFFCFFPLGLLYTGNFLWLVYKNITTSIHIQDIYDNWAFPQEFTILFAKAR